jgi:GH15 family glucan-1,4-alpha-glucosidase
MWNGNSIISKAAKNKETCILSKILKVQNKGTLLFLFIFQPLASSIPIGNQPF